MPDKPGGGGFLKARCRCGAGLWCERAQAGKTQTCPKCGVVFRAAIARDAQGREQVTVSFPPAVTPPATGAPARPTRRRTKPGIPIRNVRTSKVAPIVPERPREPSRDGQFVIDMTSEQPREVGEGTETHFEKAGFGAQEFEDATFSSREIVQPYKAGRETIPGIMYTTCPCGEPALVKKGDIGHQMRCPGCGRTMLVEGTRDPQTREIVIRLKPVETRKQP